MTEQIQVGETRSFAAMLPEGMWEKFVAIRDDGQPIDGWAKLELDLAAKANMTQGYEGKDTYKGLLEKVDWEKFSQQDVVTNEQAFFSMVEVFHLLRKTWALPGNNQHIIPYETDEAANDSMYAKVVPYFRQFFKPEYKNS